MRVSRWVVPVVSVLILFGGVGVAQASGWWITSGRQALVPGAQMTVDDLKGWMTLQQAADGLGLTLADIVAEIGPPAGVELVAETAFKDVEGLVPGFSLADLRERLRTRLTRSPEAEPPEAPAPSLSVTPTHQPATAGAPAVTGQSTLREVAEQAGVSPEALIAEAGLPPGTDPDVPLRTLRDTVPGFEIQQVRDAVGRLG